jgi:hypothetical protein
VRTIQEQHIQHTALQIVKIVRRHKVCLRSEDAFVIICVANLMEVKVLYVQQDLRSEISSYWRFNVQQFHTNLNRTRETFTFALNIVINHLLRNAII